MTEQPVIIDGWTVLTPKHISRKFETVAEALLESLLLRDYGALPGFRGKDDYTITLRQTTVHVTVK